MNGFEYLNEESIRNADVRIARSGFRYGFIEDLILDEKYEELVTDFPDVSAFKFVNKMSGGGTKRFYVGPVYSTGKDGVCTCRVRSLSPAWRSFMTECASSQAIDLFRTRTGVPMNALCHFGLTYGNAGCVQEPHVDGAVREYDDSPIKSTWATIVYFNRESGGPGGTCIYDVDRTTVLFQAPSMRNGLFFFEQHPDAWHGFPKMPSGTERRVLSLAYSNEVTPIRQKTGLAHKLTCKKFWRSLVR